MLSKWNIRKVMQKTHDFHILHKYRCVEEWYIQLICLKLLNDSEDFIKNALFCHTPIAANRTLALQLWSPTKDVFTDITELNWTWNQNLPTFNFLKPSRAHYVISYS